MSLCKSCGLREAEELCALCEIVKGRHERVARRWHTIKLRKMEECWLDAAFEALEFVENNVLAVVCIRVRQVDDTAVDMVARLVGLCYRSGHEFTGRRIYDTYKSRFQISGSKMCVLASTWYGTPLEGVRRSVIAVLRECSCWHREASMGLVVYRMYRHLLGPPVACPDDRDLLAEYRRLSINAPP